MKGEDKKGWGVFGFETPRRTWELNEGLGLFEEGAAPSIVIRRPGEETGRNDGGDDPNPTNDPDPDPTNDPDLDLHANGRVGRRRSAAAAAAAAAARAAAAEEGLLPFMEEALKAEEDYESAWEALNPKPSEPLNPQLPDDPFFLSKQIKKHKTLNDIWREEGAQMTVFRNCEVPLTFTNHK